MPIPEREPLFGYFDGRILIRRCLWYANTMKDTERAWMAGFVDGEGCLTISCQVRKNRPSPTYRAFVTISNTNRDVLTSFLDEYGGAIYSAHERRTDKRKVRWSDAHTWHCPIASTPQFLRDIFPFLRLKQAQALILLDFCENKAPARNPRRANGMWGGSEPLTEDELQRRARWHDQVRLLNSKGPTARAAMEQIP